MFNIQIARVRALLRAPLCVLLCAPLCVFALVACGGGESSNPRGNFGAVFSQSSVDAQGIEGTPQAVPLVATVSYTGASNTSVSLRAETDERVVLGVDGHINGSTLEMIVTLRGDLPEGDHSTELVLHACFDEECTQEPSGSPVRLPIRYHVKPNLQVQQQLVLSREGSEAAPNATLPVTIPPEAGVVTMQASNSRPDAIDLSFDGSALRVTTQQVRAGSYAATVTLQSTTDARYSRTVNVQYTVAAPPGGEHELSVADPNRTVPLQQGSGSIQHLVVTRPTWTNAWDEPQIGSDTARMLTLTDLGNGQYDVAINSAGVSRGSYSPSIRFSAGPTGGAAVVYFNVWVTSSFYVDGNGDHTLSATSTAADLSWSNPVLTFDGASARWTAVSQSPLLRVVNSSGQTGVDALQLRLDPAALSLPSWGQVFPVVVSIDRAGTLPETLQVSVLNSIPTLQIASPATLVGSSGRVYIQGAFRNFVGDPVWADRLRIDGATLSHGQLIGDPRSLNDYFVLALELTGATPGQPITVGVDNSLLPTQLQLQVQPPLRAALGYQALPYASYRPGQFVPGIGALYFSSPNTVHRWAPGASGWALSQATVTGLIDVAPSPDESQLFASKPTEVVVLDPQTFAQQSAGALTDSFSPVLVFDASAAAGTRALVFSADGRALASISYQPDQGSHLVGTMGTPQLTRAVPALTASLQSCDPGSAKGWIDGPTGSGLVRSANGAIVVGVNPNGRRSTYRADDRQWVQASALPAGLMVSAIADSGSRLVRSDGMVIDGNDTQLGNLGSVVPFNATPGGYGLSSGGRFGFVYGYSTTGEGASQRATQATLWVVDLNNAASTGVASAPVVAAIAMPNAVGCTGAFAAGETCQHNASITVAPGDGTAFVLGPRGVAAIPLPAGVNSAQALSGMRRSATATSARPPQSPSTTVRLPIRGSVRPK